MLVSHESPIAILEESKSYNDYDYALVHLFETQPDYLNFFKRSLAAGREVLLDNSIFELGKAFDPSKYIDYASDLDPTFLIVPDVLEDAKATMSSWNTFHLNYKLSDYTNASTIGVVQGETYQDIVDCYKFMSDNADYIAISFDYSWYNKIAYSQRPGRLGHLDRYCSGRPHLINRLVDDGVWDNTKPHHLLGCGLPQEFSFYNNAGWDWIYSLDTSNPVVHGLKGIEYKDSGLWDKESQKLFTMINSEVSEDQLNTIKYNVNMFRQLANGTTSLDSIL